MNNLKSFIVGFLLGIVILLSAYQNMQLNNVKHKVDNVAEFAQEAKADTSKIISEMTRANRCALDPQCLKIAEALYFESGNNSKQDKIAVANVIKNRLHLSIDGDETYISIITEKHNRKCQFSYLCERKTFTIEDKDMWKDSVDAASLVFYNLVSDNTNGATHYYAHKKIKKPWKFPITLKTDVHTFCREVKK